VKNRKGLDFEVDKLTNSIEEILTGKSFETEITRIRIEDAHLVKSGEWLFDWQIELREPGHEVYKLTTRKEPDVVHGLISFDERNDHIFVDLIESASFNRGKTKIFDGVPGNLVAFACKTSFERGYDGHVVFTAKTVLIEHYKKSLGAKRFWANNMLLETEEALRLVRRYFKDFDDTRL
jgi:hypothetical protein